MFLITLAGCGNDPDTTSGDRGAVVDDPATPSETVTTEAAEEATGAPTEDTSSEPAEAGLEARLLTAAELPGANDETEWTVASTAAEDGPFGTCQRFDMASLGAGDAVVRTFTSNQDTVEGGQVLAEFSDAKSAWRAHQVLKTWHKKCAEQVEAGTVEVGPLDSLAQGTAVADAYVVHYGDKGADEQQWDGVGISRTGPLLSVVQIGLVGQDYNYPAGQEPAAEAARLALAKLG
ncbi:hypothetical protein EKO23_12245 [Nocardioides guangzhouensis]|uniref:Sensor domain-containing protein n=1 Tax=Nocardioides guangzhouensis TaxID=2497878 RepID=A0A4Q4ZDS2_9ACTN|nr:hypothetical protein EKO23_12245 [Nocardioides guangzhouensis]